MQFKVCDFKINYSKLNPFNHKFLFFKKLIKILIIIIVVAGAVIVVKNEIFYRLGKGLEIANNNLLEDLSYDMIDVVTYIESDGFYSNIAREEREENKACNVKGIEMHGTLVPYISPEELDDNGNLIDNETASENIVFAIEQANKNDDIKAIILEVDSYGGSPVAAEEVEKALKESAKPTVTLVRTAAASAAYWASTGADIIFASNMSDVGSIGVTSSYVDNSKSYADNGYTFNSLSVGKFKDYGNPDKPLTLDERKLIMRDLNIVYENFIKEVAANRNLEIEKVKLLADGSSMPGQLALENGLIDRIGGVIEVEEYLKNKIGEEIEICW